jgi:transaldolase
MTSPEESVYQLDARAVASFIERFAASYADSDSKQPVKDDFTRGYYSCVFNLLSASPLVWALLSREAQATINKAKRLIDDHYHNNDTPWPPAPAALKSARAG